MHSLAIKYSLIHRLLFSFHVFLNGFIYISADTIIHYNFELFKSMQLVMSTAPRTFLPFVNLLLSKGFPLPLHGFTLQNVHIFYNGPWVTLCSYISFLEHYLLSWSSTSLCIIKTTIRSLSTMFYAKQELYVFVVA